MQEGDVWSVLNRNLFFVKNVVNSHELKTSDKFDVFDPATGTVVLECREPDLGVMTKVQRALGGKYDMHAPFNLLACIPQSGEQVLRISRESTLISLGVLPIGFFDHNDQPVCQMKKTFFSLGLAFRFFRDKDATLFDMKVKSVLNGYKLIINKKEVARVMLRWKKEHAEVFKNTKSKYAISISPDVPQNNVVRQLLLAFAISINRVKN